MSAIISAKPSVTLSGEIHCVGLASLMLLVSVMRSPVFKL
jgi:hypothetical protein